MTVGDLVRSTDGAWMVRCGTGHPITPGRVLVGTAVCACQDRHLTWLCECGSMVYGPELGLGCAVLKRASARPVNTREARCGTGPMFVVALS
jgi:hypothetical protein